MYLFCCCDPLNQLFDSQSIPSFWKDLLELLQISHHEKKGLSINIIICIMNVTLQLLGLLYQRYQNITTGNETSTFFSIPIHHNNT